MKRALSRFLPLFILFTSVFAMPTRDTRDTRDRESEEDGILIDEALLRIFEAEDELASVVQEIQQLHHQREFESSSPHEDTSVDEAVPGYFEEQPMGDQPLEDQLQGDQPMEELPQGDMPMTGPVDDNEAQDIGASPTPIILGGANTSIPPEREIQEFTSGEVRQKLLQRNYIMERVLSVTRPGSKTADSFGTSRRRLNNTEHVQSIVRMFNRAAYDQHDNQPKPTSGGLLDLLRSINDVSNSGFTKMQSLFPSCDIPKNTDEEVWLTGEDSFSMNLLFDFNQTKLGGHGLDVREATLRLFKMAQTQDSGPWVTSCDAQSTTTESNTESNLTEEISTTSENPEISTKGQRPKRNPRDQLVKVSVYLYTRALKKNRVKRKLLESQTLSLNKDEWTAWNVLSAAKLYLQTRKNFGLLIEVEDENNCLLPAHRILKSMNCTGETATARPLPYPIMKVHDTLNHNTFPIMDIRSYEIHPAITGPPADMDILSTAAQPSEAEAPEQTLITRPTRRTSPTRGPLEGHRHRHGDNASSGNHRRRRKPHNTTEDEDIPDLRSLIIPQRVIMTADEQRRLRGTTPQPVTR